LLKEITHSLDWEDVTPIKSSKKKTPSQNVERKQLGGTIPHTKKSRVM
jgi:hypothetical protein